MARMTPKQNLASTVETLKAYWRQGLHELGNALYGPGTAAAAPEYGMLGTKPQSEIAKGLTGQSHRGELRGELHHATVHAADTTTLAVEPVAAPEPAHAVHANASHAHQPATQPSLQPSGPEPSAPQPSALDRYTEPHHEPDRAPERAEPTLEPDRD